MLSKRREEADNIKELEEMMQEAMAQILLYRSEWTNYHVSDPGIAILENLTAFQALQRSGLYQVSSQAVEMLCGLAGFYREKGQAASVWLTRRGTEGPDCLLPGQKLYAGGLCFETEQEVDTRGSALTGLFLETDGNLRGIGTGLAKETPGSVLLFGSRPEAGDCLYFILERLPGPGEWLTIWMKAAPAFPRNRIPETAGGLFADLSWSLYTKGGYCRIVCQDGTGAFLQDGLIRLKMPEMEGSADPRFGGTGYTLRCRLDRAEYDSPPRARFFLDFLFPVRQKNTLAATLEFQTAEGFSVRNAMLETCELTVYGLERDGFYYRYEEAGEARLEDDNKRWFWREREELGTWRFTLDGEGLVRESGAGKPCAVLVLRRPEFLSHYQIGRIYGYLGETLSLRPLCHILGDTFVLSACLKTPDGGEKYQFYRPGEKERGGLRYTLLAEEGAIRIEDAGAYEEARLSLCACVVYQGERGNIRAENGFSLNPSEDQAVFYNPFTGRGGRAEETVEAVGRRFAADIRKSYVLVTQEDYEVLIRQIPGLSIHKVRAFAVEGGDIRVAVKPGSEEPFPRLSAVYRRIIQAEIEKRRMLAARVTLLDPVYIPVDVSGTILLSPFYENAEKQVEEALITLLDCVSSDRPFGSVLSFYEICHALEAMDCVTEVSHLALHPRSRDSVQMQGADIRMQESCLCYPGRLELEYGRKR